MDEDGTRLGGGDNGFRDAGVGTADPENLVYGPSAHLAYISLVKGMELCAYLGFLSFRKPRKESRIVLSHLSCPHLILRKEVIDNLIGCGGHGGICEVSGLLGCTSLCLLSVALPSMRYVTHECARRPSDNHLDDERVETMNKC